MHINFLILLVAALIPILVGLVWYNPKTFGKAWAKSAGIAEGAKMNNMAVVFGLTFLFSFFLAFIMQMLTIHQFHVGGLLMTQPDSADPNSEAAQMLKKFMELFGNSYRTFKHGAFHGTLAGIMLALPILGINALFEGKGFKYIAINAGFWIVCMALMGGIICGFA